MSPPGTGGGMPLLGWSLAAYCERGLLGSLAWSNVDKSIGHTSLRAQRSHMKLPLIGIRWSGGRWGEAVGEGESKRKETVGHLSPLYPLFLLLLFLLPSPLTMKAGAWMGCQSGAACYTPTRCVHARVSLRRHSSKFTAVPPSSGRWRWSLRGSGSKEVGSSMPSDRLGVKFS
ncbi:hypothetical protein Q8A73_007427 [Channa argus]|nr:hypothetical protein Q8A73_007427 [Channa argus]